MITRASIYLYKSILKTTKLTLDKNAILALGVDGNRNWGDALNPILIQKISGIEPLILTKHTVNVRNKEVYSIIGSILRHANKINCGHDNLIVWGSGLISSKDRLRVRPKDIRAVRGPLTRDILLKQKYRCPEIYGDPALLYPRFYKPIIPKKYKLGIIPHLIDRNEDVLNNLIADPDVLIIDICNGIHNVIDKICSCEKIASSSLHGIIAADAYGIQSTWIKISNNVTGNGFKFFDYFASVGRTDERALVIHENTSIDDILNAYYHYKLDINLNELWDVCPLTALRD